ncbi:MAG: alpha/beta hydrolase [Actinomycetota bacterium]|nr:alpha/beta hydrolase [Actinomycetota bacterium]
MGLSIGGMFALYFAAKHPDRIRVVVPINTCLSLNDPGEVRVVFDREAPATVPGVGSDIKAEGVEELVYSEVPVSPLKEFMAILRVTDDLLPTITAPALILQSTEDHVVTTSSRPGTAHTYWRSSAEKTKSWSG